MPSGYSSREDPGQMKKNKQSMADLKLRRLTELNTRLREDLERERIPVSQAAKSIINYTNSTKDFMVPSVWGTVDKREDPYTPQREFDDSTFIAAPSILQSDRQFERKQSFGL
jgi:guanine nucleotide-binding protein subunit gamma